MTYQNQTDETSKGRQRTSIDDSSKTCTVSSTAEKVPRPKNFYENFCWDLISTESATRSPHQMRGSTLPMELPTRAVHDSDTICIRRRFASMQPDVQRYQEAHHNITYGRYMPIGGCRYVRANDQHCITQRRSKRPWHQRSRAGQAVAAKVSVTRGTCIVPSLKCPGSNLSPSYGHLLGGALLPARGVQ